MAEKRASDTPGGALVKRQRTDGDEPKSTSAMILSGKSAAEASGALTKTVKRTSALQAPIMLLTGHQVGLFAPWPAETGLTRGPGRGFYGQIQPRWATYCVRFI